MVLAIFVEKLYNMMEYGLIYFSDLMFSYPHDMTIDKQRCCGYLIKLGSKN